MESGQMGEVKIPHPWTDAERRFVSAHRLDGYELISQGLRGMGYERTPKAVQRYAEKAGIKVGKNPQGGMPVCASCGSRYARPNTRAGRAGYCPTCWKRMQADALREGRAERAAQADYDNAKHARKRRKG